MINNTVLQALFILIVANNGLAQYHDGKGLVRRIFDGQKPDSKMNKHLVKLEFKILSQTVHWQIQQTFCSGSIISHRWILTTAHCFTNHIMSIIVMHQENGKLYEIAKGAGYNLRDSSYVAEDESNRNNEKDLALLHTQKGIAFTDRIQPISLARKSIKPGTSAIIAGYGEVEQGFFGLRQGVVKIRQCSVTRGSSLLCSKNVVRAGGGDSGGSLVYKGQLVGVTSKSCRNVYISKPCVTIYIDVAVNLGWIMEVINIDYRA